MERPKKPLKPRRVSYIEQKRKRGKSVSRGEVLELMAYAHDLFTYDSKRAVYESYLESERLRVKAEEQAEKDALFERRCRRAWAMITGLLIDPDLLTDAHTSSRLIGVVVRECRPYNFIEWTSCKFQAAVDRARSLGKKKPKPCKEHIYPTQFNGLVLYQHMKVMGDLPYEVFREYIEVFRQVAHVTGKENNALGLATDAPQNPGIFIAPEWAYEQANVKLVGEKFAPIKRLESVAPAEVLEAVFGDRLPQTHKYNR